MSLERFGKIYEIVQIKVKAGVLGNKTLGTNQIRKELDNLVKNYGREWKSIKKTTIWLGAGKLPWS